MKKILFTTMLFSVLTTANAQHEFGLLAGINATTTASGRVYRSDNYGWGIGWYAGGAYQWNISNQWALQPQLVFSYETNGVSPHNQWGLFSSRYALGIPVEIAYQMPLSSTYTLSVSAGPYILCAVYGKRGDLLYNVDADGGWHKVGVTTTSWKSSVEFGNRIDYGVQGGASLRHGHLMYSLKCKYGFRQTYITGGNLLSFSLGASYFF